MEDKPSRIRLDVTAEVVQQGRRVLILLAEFSNLRREFAGQL
ncbi:MAG TPA: hypothetical protein VIJ38_09795 [Acidobacteriaceae bacterium]